MEKSLRVASSTVLEAHSKDALAGCAMHYALQHTVFLAALTAALAALDPCSEVYPGLNADFVSTQTKVIVCLTPFQLNVCAPHDSTLPPVRIEGDEVTCNLISCRCCNMSHSSKSCCLYCLK